MTEAEMMADLAAADAAGDTQLAQAIATRIKAGRGPQAVASHATVATAPPPQVGIPEAGIRGAVQGASLGFGDEAAAAIDAALPKFLRNATSDEAVGAGQTYGERYKNARDFYRGRNRAAEEQHGNVYTGGQIVGALASLKGLPVKGAPGVLSAAGQGAVQGAGYSEANDGTGLARDISLGGALGLAGHGAGSLLGKASQGLAGGARRLLGSARGRALGQATQESVEEVASSTGKLGAETRHGGRYIESLLDKESKGLLRPEQTAEIAALRASGELPALAQSVAQNTLEALPGQLKTIAARRAELEALRQAAPQKIAERTKELLKPSVKADAKSFAKGWLEPLAWAYGADQVGGLMGLDETDRLKLAGAAGLIGGRTRAGKALYNRIRKPGNQTAAAQKLERLAEGIKKLRKPLVVGSPAALLPPLVEDETP